jgi:choline dehydrogenase-like flavoprotein
VPGVHCDDHANNLAMVQRAMYRAAASDARVHAVNIMRVGLPPTTNKLVTSRMASNPEDGVANRCDLSHDGAKLFVANGSQFPAASAPDPTLTIVALAIRQAEQVAKMMNRRAM